MQLMLGRIAPHQHKSSLFVEPAMERAFQSSRLMEHAQRSTLDALADVYHLGRQGILCSDRPHTAQFR